MGLGRPADESIRRRLMVYSFPENSSLTHPASIRSVPGIPSKVYFSLPFSLRSLARPVLALRRSPRAHWRCPHSGSCSTGYRSVGFSSFPGTAFPVAAAVQSSAELGSRAAARPLHVVVGVRAPAASLEPLTPFVFPLLPAS